MPEIYTLSFDEFVACQPTTPEWHVIGRYPPTERTTTTPESTLTLIHNPRHQSWWPDEFTAMLELIESDNIEGRICVPGDEGYAERLNLAFEFLRQFGDGRYTDATLMSLIRSADQLREYRSDVMLSLDGTIPGPVVLSVHEEFHYDEETEVKKGGMIGMLALLPAGEGVKALLVVRESHRRNGYGRALFSMARSMVGELSLAAWAASTNIIGQQFLLSQRFIPSAMNGRGAIRFVSTDNRGEGDV